MKTARKDALAACLSAALLTLLTPVVFFFHAGCGGAHAPVQAPPLPVDAAAGFAGRPGADAPHAHYEPRGAAFHDAASCLLCQTLLQSMAGGTPGEARNAPAGGGAGAGSPAIARIAAHGGAARAFLSRAPPGSC